MSDTVTLINSNLLSVYNAEIVSFTVSPYKISDNVFQTSFSIVPIPLAGNLGPREIKLTLDFYDVTNGSKAVKSISNLLKTLISRNDSGYYTELYLRDGFYYTCCFTDVSDPVEKAPWIQQCTFSFVGFRHKQKLSNEWSNSTSGTLSSYPDNDIDSPVYIKITPATMPSVLSLQAGNQNITFTGATGFVEIDTLNATVKDSLGNALGKCDMTEFPVIKVGLQAYWRCGTASTVKMEVLPIVM